MNKEQKDNGVVTVSCYAFEKKNSSGIGGWLIVIVVQLVVVFIYNSVGLFDDVSNSMRPIAFDAGIAIDKGAMDLFFVLGCTGNLLVALMALCSLYALLKKMSKFKKYYRLFVYFSFLYPLLFAAWFFGYQNLMVSSFLWGILTLVFAYPVAMTYICLPYLKLSRRVRFTFIN